MYTIGILICLIVWSQSKISKPFCEKSNIRRGKANLERGEEGNARCQRLWRVREKAVDD